MRLVKLMTSNGVVALNADLIECVCMVGNDPKSTQTKIFMLNRQDDTVPYLVEGTFDDIVGVLRYAQVS